MGSQERSKEPPRRNPTMSIYRSRALKVSPGRKHHGIVTKTQANDGCDGRRGYGGRSRERGVSYVLASPVFDFGFYVLSN
jgi:hypothetical protein